MSKTIEITRVEDVRAGDVVTLDYNGHTLTGPAYWDGPPGDRILRVGPLGVRDSNGHPVLGGYPFVRATREVPDLPTEPGSVIVASGDDYGHEFAHVPLMLFRDSQWVGVGPTGNSISIPADAITAWTPAHIVPATETTTEVPNRCGGCWDLGPF